MKALGTCGPWSALADEPADESPPRMRENRVRCSGVAAWPVGRVRIVSACKLTHGGVEGAAISDIAGFKWS